MVASFRGEVERLCKLRHPNVLAFYGAVTQPPSLCIVTELMVGVTEPSLCIVTQLMVGVTEPSLCIVTQLMVGVTEPNRLKTWYAENRLSR